jgi:hypothetical protein
MFSSATAHFPFSETEMISVLLIQPMDLLVGPLTEMIIYVFNFGSLSDIPARISDLVHLFYCLSIVATLIILARARQFGKGHKTMQFPLLLFLIRGFSLEIQSYTLSGLWRG